MNSLIYLFKNDCKHILKKFFIKNFFKIFFIFFKIFKKLKKDKFGNFYLINIKNLKSKKKAKKIFIAISYCQKPKNCPSKKFSENCFKNSKSEICKNCQFFKISKPLYFITTVSEFAKKILQLKKDEYFLITACRYSIKKFYKYAYLLNLKGAAFELTKNCCTNFKTFYFAEKGYKKNETFLSKNSQDAFFNFLLNNSFANDNKDKISEDLKSFAKKRVKIANTEV